MATILRPSPSHSPRLTPPPHPHQGDPLTGFLSPSLSPSIRRDNKSRIGHSKSASPIVKPHSAHVSAHPPPYTSQSSSTPAQAQSSPSQARHTSSFPAARPPCTSPKEQRSYQPSVRSISTQTSFSPIRITSRPSTPTPKPQVFMVDAQTQYSPPLTSLPNSGPNSSVEQRRSPQITSGPFVQTPISNLANLRLNKSASQSPQPKFTRPIPSAATHSNKRPYEPVTDAEMPAAPPGLTTSISTIKKEQEQTKTETGSSQTPQSSSKRDHSTTSSETLPTAEDDRSNGVNHEDGPSATAVGTAPSTTTTATPSKKPRPADPEVKTMPLRYETCDTRDLVILISSMLMELIRYNDTIPLSSGTDPTTSSTSNLTRFHSRAPPGISVIDYLQRLATYATLSPPILLSMVYYIDRLASFYPAFTISSLTVHRFLITAATVASKGLSDSFWTNKTYARVGGVSIKELALLELEFLERVNWRIVPRPETLVDYYKSLVGRSVGYRLEGAEDGGVVGGEGGGAGSGDSDIES